MTCHRTCQAEPTEYDLFLLRFADRSGSLEGAKDLFLRKLVRAAIRREGSCVAAAKNLRVHRNTITRHLKQAGGQSQ